jgi:hypothetical protein
MKQEKLEKAKEKKIKFQRFAYSVLHFNVFKRFLQYTIPNILESSGFTAIRLDTTSFGGESTEAVFLVMCNPSVNEL